MFLVLEELVLSLKVLQTHLQTNRKSHSSGYQTEEKYLVEKKLRRGRNDTSTLNAPSHS